MIIVHHLEFSHMPLFKITLMLFHRFRITAKDAPFEQRLHLIYLVNDVLHHWWVEMFWLFLVLLSEKVRIDYFHLCSIQLLIFVCVPSGSSVLLLMQIPSVDELSVIIDCTTVVRLVRVVRMVRQVVVEEISGLKCHMLQNMKDVSVIPFTFVFACKCN